MSQQVTALAPGLYDKKSRYTPGWSHKLASHKILNRVFSKRGLIAEVPVRERRLVKRLLASQGWMCWKKWSETRL